MSKNKKGEKKKLQTIDVIFVYLQILLTILTFILFIVFIFQQEIFKILQLSLGFDLLVMAYNNQRIYRRKFITAVYAFIGIILIILDILLFIGV